MLSYFPASLPPNITTITVNSDYLNQHSISNETKETNVPDIELVLGISALTGDISGSYRGLLGLTNEFYKEVFTAYEGYDAFSIVPVLLQPKSRGRVTLKSPDPFDRPIFETNYYDQEDDLKTMVRGIRKVILYFLCDIYLGSCLPCISQSRLFSTYLRILLIFISCLIVRLHFFFVITLSIPLIIIIICLNFEIYSIYWIFRFTLFLSENLSISWNYLKLIFQAIEVASTKAFKRFNATLLPVAFPGCKHVPFGTDPYWTCVARQVTTTLGHFVGTCKMGPRRNSGVVDHRLRVHGINGLRVVDASIIPTIVTGHTNAVAYMIAEKAADMIKEDWKILNSEFD